MNCETSIALEFALNENAENRAKMLQTCSLNIAISQDWVDEF